MTAARVLVTGGVRSGKSRHAEQLLLADGVEGPVVYLAAGDPAGDADWQARLAAHRARRPASWHTVEAGERVPEALADADGPVLVDCLGTWLTAVIDAAGAWEAPEPDVAAALAPRIEALLAALARPRSGPVVLVTNEVGLGVVPAHRSGRLFRDHLGSLNQQVGAVVDEVHLVVAGRVLVL